MASIRSDKGWLLLDFRHRGERYREYLNLRDTRDGRREAEHVKRRIEVELRGGTFEYVRAFPNGSRAAVHLAAQPTLGEFARTWLDERAPRLRPQTLYDYQCILRAYILSHPIAQTRLAEISDAHINLLVKDLSERPARSGKPLSARLINTVLARLRDMFTIAYRRKLIADNPTAYVPNLKEKKPEVDPFEPDEVRRLLAAAVGWERAFLCVLVFGGLRPNEALALHWLGIDRQRNTMRVRRNLTRFGFGPPKTERSDRTIEMAEPLRAAFQEQRARSELAGELVFPGRAGTPVELANFRHRNWPRILRRAGLTERPLYQCRHTFARLALEAGEAPQWVAAQLGHTSVQMVFQVYGRWARPPARRALFDQFAQTICPPSAQTGGKLAGDSGRSGQHPQHAVFTGSKKQWVVATIFEKRPKSSHMQEVPGSSPGASTEEFPNK
jgi:integrase